jgi:endonuclease-3
VLDALEGAYGRPRWRKREEPLAVLVRGVLSQNTSDVNSGRAFENLMAEFGTWPVVAAARTGRIARAIRSGGLADQKAATIKALLRWLDGKGGYSLDFLRGLDSGCAERELTAIKGVGIKTARLTLMFGFGRPVFVVDTHVLRVSRRLGLVPERCGREKAHVLLDPLVPDARKYSGHLNIIAHGRSVCHARSPECDGCCVRRWCVHVRDGSAAT